MNKMSPHLINESRKALYIPIDDKEYTVSLTKYIPVNNNIIAHISIASLFMHYDGFYINNKVNYLYLHFILDKT